MKKGKKTVGRPTIMTADVIGKLELAFSLGCTDLEACFFAGISKDALYTYQAKNVEFRERKEALKEKLVFKARQVVADALDCDDAATARWYLERKKKDEFSTRQENVVSAIDNRPFEIKIVE